jgi:hypothetical protein
MNVWVWNPTSDGWDWNPATLEAWATTGLAVFTVVAVFFAGLSWRGSRAEIRSRMRPWVGLFGFEFMQDDDAGEQWLRVLLRNFGPLPAQKAALVVVLRPERLNDGEQPNPARSEKQEENILMPLEDGKYGVRLSPYPQVAVWISERRKVIAEGTFSYALGKKTFESKFVGELWFGSRPLPNGSVPTNWRNVSAT